MMGMVSGMVLAQEFDARGDSTKELRMPQIEILTQRDRVLSRVPGSVTVVDFRSIQKIAPIHGNELFRKIPGLNVVDEEGPDCASTLAFGAWILTGVGMCWCWRMGFQLRSIPMVNLSFILRLPSIK